MLCTYVQNLCCVLRDLYTVLPSTSVFFLPFAVYYQTSAALPGLTCVLSKLCSVLFDFYCVLLMASCLLSVGDLEDYWILQRMSGNTTPVPYAWVIRFVAQFGILSGFPFADDIRPPYPLNYAADLTSGQHLLLLFNLCCVLLKGRLSCWWTGGQLILPN